MKPVSDTPLVTPKYIPVIDAIRGLAAVSVMLFHFICTTTGFIKTEWILKIFSWGEEGVYMFFVISGIVIPLSMINSKYTPASFFKFMLKRIIRLDPPYFVALIIGIAIAYVRLMVPGTVQINTIPSTKEILLHIGYLVPFFENVKWVNAAFWSLAVEFQYYIILALTISLFSNKKMLLRIAGYFLFILFGIMGTKYPHKDWTLAYMPLFLMGITYCTRLCKIISYTEQAIIMIICSITLIFTFNYEIVITAFFTLGIIHFFRNYSNKITVFFGNISYSIYLMHGLLGASFINILSHKVDGAVMKGAVIVGGIIITIISSYMLYRFVEEPSKKLSSKIYRRKK